MYAHKQCSGTPTWVNHMLPNHTVSLLHWKISYCQTCNRLYIPLTFTEVILKHWAHTKTEQSQQERLLHVSFPARLHSCKTSLTPFSQTGMLSVQAQDKCLAFISENPVVIPWPSSAGPKLARSTTDQLSWILNIKITGWVSCCTQCTGGMSWHGKDNP